MVKVALELLIIPGSVSVPDSFKMTLTLPSLFRKKETTFECLYFHLIVSPFVCCSKNEFVWQRSFTSRRCGADALRLYPQTISMETWVPRGGNNGNY